jgi:Na+/H+-dicarboxylate symporter
VKLQTRWLGDNVAGPAGQMFLRLLLMTVVPLVFASVTLGGSSGCSTCPAPR